MRTLGMMLMEEWLAQPMNEMANAPKRVTGLPVYIWIEAKEPTQHNLPRIKFQNNYSDKISRPDLVPLIISDDPYIPIKNWNELKISSKDFERVRQWVIRNKQLLLDYWNDKITSYDVFEKNSKDTGK